MSKTFTPASLKGFTFDYMFKPGRKEHWSFRGSKGKRRANQRMMSSGVSLQPSAAEWKRIAFRENDR